MGTTLVICFFLATHLHAESLARASSATSISTSTTATLDSSLSSADATTTSSLFDVDEELAKIAASCLTHREHEQLSGDILRHGMARIFNVNLVNEAQEVIGLTELRAVLGFAPPGPWTNYRKPSTDEIATAPTIEAYFELREPRSEMRSLDSSLFFEKNFPPAIAFLDKRFPAIRTIYRRKFEEIRRRPNAKVTIDRKEVDHMIDESTAIFIRIDHTITQMYQNRECLRASRMHHNLYK